MTVSPTIKRIAQAIATAEGFSIPGSRPNRDNNPGDIKADLIGKAIGWDGEFPMYATVEDGWENLYKQVSAMLSGLSKYYNPGMSIAEIGGIYAAGDPNWAVNVANGLGVSTDTPIGEV